MPTCPVCEEIHGSYFVATAAALGDLLDLMPRLADGMAHWLLLPGSPTARTRDGRPHPIPDHMLVLLCERCALRARKQRRLSEDEFWLNSAHPCPCCGYCTLDTPGDHEICPVCFWHDDGDWRPDGGTGPNRITLRQARKNFTAFGGFRADMVQHVARPGPLSLPRYNV